MILSDKICITFDIEVLPNCFTCSTMNTETDEINTFEISVRTNDITNLYKFFTNTNAYFVGYNCQHYDTLILNALFKTWENHQDINSEKICTIAYGLTKALINDDEISSKLIKAEFGYQNYFKQIDLLTMLYSKALRVSLKWMQVTMHYENVLEMQIDWDKPIDIKDIPTLIYYNHNDIKSTAELLKLCENDLLLRINIQNRNKIECLSKDGVGIGVDLLADQYCKQTGISKWSLKDMRSPCPRISLKDVILPWITFESDIFKDMLKNMKELTISDGRKTFEFQTIYNGLKYSVGVGGLHSLNTPGIIKPEKNEVLIDCDVQSYYPSLIIQHGFGPKHLGKTFIEIYSSIKDERVQAKHNKDKLRDLTLKLLLNSVTGNLGNEYSWMYDPFAVLQIRINGQLMLLMLTEALTNIGCTVVSANTDGLTTRVPKDKLEQYYQICKDWEILTKMNLEYIEYKQIVIKAVNDYIAETTDGHIKEKGLFITKTLLGKGLSPEIIPIALQQYFVHNIPVEQTIKNCKDIKQFLIGEKTGKQWAVEYLGVPVQHINRYFVSKRGAYLHKTKKLTNGEESVTRMCAKPVRILNKFNNNLSIEDYEIDYQYYITECNKIIWEIEPPQLNLFN